MTNPIAVFFFVVIIGFIFTGVYFIVKSINELLDIYDNSAKHLKD